MSAAVIVPYVSLAAGVNALTGGSITNALGMGPDSGDRVGGGTGSGTQAAADPFAPYRANLGALYSGALTSTNKQDITQMPGFTQFQTGVMDPALEASKRSSAASGMLRSGNEQIALQNTAQKGYYGFMTDYLNRLAQGSGAVNNPAAAASLGVNQGNLNDAAFMQGLGGLATGLKGIYGSGGSTPSTPTATGPTFESDINTSGFYDTAPADINMSGFYNAD